VTSKVEVTYKESWENVMDLKFEVTCIEDHYSARLISSKSAHTRNIDLVSVEIGYGSTSIKAIIRLLQLIDEGQ